MRHALTKDRLRVVNDQIGAVTCAGLIAQVTDDLIKKDAVAQIDSGIYHLCSSGEGSWFDVAVYAIKRASEMGVLLRCDASNVQPVSSDQYPVRAVRPKSSKLSTEKLQRILTNPLPHWKMCVDVTIDELLMKDFFQ
jgi:dTDP-4-dehydrorhamnose reductase